jgi:hypothetical protein
MWTDRLLRALGADPKVFRPLYRVYRIMLQRGTRLVRKARGKAGSQAMLFLSAAACGMFTAVLFTMQWRSFLPAGLGLTLSCAFLLMIVLGDHADALVHRGERLVLAAHPHDDRSLLLAKLAAVGRSLAVLWLLLFGVPTLFVIGVHGPGAALAFLAGAAGAALATTALGLTTAVLIGRLGGRRATDRLLAWLPAAFQAVYLTVMLGINSIARLKESQVPARLRDLLSWLLPGSWFAAPLEIAAGGSTASAWGRLALATGCLVILGALGGRLVTGLGSRLLEPEPHAGAAARRRAAPPPKLLASVLRFEGLRLLSLFRVHLRSDWRARSELLAMPVVLLVCLVFYSLRFGAAGGPLTLFMYGWMLLVSADGLTRSQRPENLWWLLSSPIDRTRFSMATISLLRLVVLLPGAAVATLLGEHSRFPTDGGWPQRLVALLLLVAYGDLLLLLGKAAFPDFPFSRAARSGQRMGPQFAGYMIAGLASGAGTVLVLVCRRLGDGWLLSLALLFVVLHLPATGYARRRARQAAAKLDLAELG